MGLLHLIGYNVEVGDTLILRNPSETGVIEAIDGKCILLRLENEETRKFLDDGLREISADSEDIVGWVGK